MRQIHSVSTRFLAAALTCAALSACRSTSYTSSLSLSGVDHQNELSEAIAMAVEAQVAGSQVFGTASVLVTRFTEPGTEMDPDLFDDLLQQVDLAAEHVEGGTQHVARVEESAERLFSSWQAELDQFSSEALRAHSEERMTRVDESYDALLAQLIATDEQLSQALVALRDFVLFFNHNLTPEAIQALRDENVGLEGVILEVEKGVEASGQRAEDFDSALHGVPGT